MTHVLELPELPLTFFQDDVHVPCGMDQEHFIAGVEEDMIIGQKLI